MKRAADSSLNTDGGEDPTPTPSTNYSVSGLLRRIRPNPSETEQYGRGAVLNSYSKKQSTSFSLHDSHAKRGFTQFNVGDKVLVLLNNLNNNELEMKQNQSDASIDDGRKMKSALPVNEFGYPQGQGNRLVEKQGPWIYVLATIKSIHFDENSRYYMIQREDCGWLQRAEAAWFIPIMEDSEGLQAATLAARGLSFAGRITRRNSATKFLDKVTEACRRWTKGLNHWTQSVKTQVKHFLFGLRPFSFTIHISPVNFLVLCSFIFLFGDQLALAFLPVQADYAYKIVLFIIWLILCVELILEIFIRPRSYHHLIVSEDCYASSTARFIDYFHLIFEAIALLIFIPEFIPLFYHSTSIRFDYFLQAAYYTTVSDSAKYAVIGHLFYGLIRLRVLSVVRHWRNMWMNRTVEEDENKNSISRFLFPTTGQYVFERPKDKRGDIESAQSKSLLPVRREVDDSLDNRDKLDHVAKIGNALMVVNSHRAILLLVIITATLPLILIGRPGNGLNRSYYTTVEMLQALNVRWNSSDSMSCAMLQSSINAWIASVVHSENSDYYSYLVWAELSPIRCPFQNNSTVITICNDVSKSFCRTWKSTSDLDDGTSLSTMAEITGVRLVDLKNVSISTKDAFTGIDFFTEAIFDVSSSVSNAALMCLLLQLSLVLITLVGLAILRSDASRLVIYPLRRMLKIVLRYAENPLAPSNAPNSVISATNGRDSSTVGSGDVSTLNKGGNDVLGSFETEQLITAVTKITDLLRKCWGVAGAGIISSNLANKDGKTVVFNPTVPGKLVYALFGFASIDAFNQLLRSLDQDVMILINDVANIVHSEVFRWGYGDRGQCNKNLGSSFLMVFRIGDFKEVEEKKVKATGVVFDWVGKGLKKAAVNKRGLLTSAKSFPKTKERNTSLMISDVAGMDMLQLASLPGINDFADRALIGMLKSFAGIQRNKSLKTWQKDFRLGAGVGAFSVEMIFGMDAGWAVEGAVGSEYKIDATYLSPHVNMASRMMSACRQYGLTILISQDVEQLLSEKARSKLRHIDTVTVKGSIKEQKIYTYDARKSGVNFFLYERTSEQADIDSDNYSPSIWDRDQDLLAMHSHISEGFLQSFNKGRNLYLAGSWPEAIETLREANSLLIENIMSEGLYHESDIAVWGDQILDTNSRNDSVRRIRNALGDGPSQALVSFMEAEGGFAPSTWRGVRPLIRK